MSCQLVSMIGINIDTNWYQYWYQLVPILIPIGKDEFPVVTYYKRCCFYCLFQIWTWSVCVCSWDLSLNKDGIKLPQYDNYDITYMYNGPIIIVNVKINAALSENASRTRYTIKTLSYRRETALQGAL